MGQSRFIIGIDLGTTNSVIAYVDLADPADQPPVRIFYLPQLVDVARVEPQPWLPSFLYLPGSHDLPPGATAIPWDIGRSYIVGVFAREQGALVPSRLISSAKSWLCHNGVDREANILPWGSPSEVPHLSPIEASARYLQHMREAWDQAMSNGRPEWTMANSDVVLTVPASFDEIARELTIRAAQQAGLQRLTLIEEPQAAFYSWVRAQGDSWREQLHQGQQVLVCDIGGGTTDFSLIAVRGEGETMTLERIAVGDHLMLGGDNMDLALARQVERKLVRRAGELDAKQWGALVHACRKAKEALLQETNEDRFIIHLAGRGSKVIGGSLRVDLFRDEVMELILDGFFPLCTFDEPLSRGRVGLQELGLPYATDPAIPRNLAAFLRRHQARPDAVLFNGGAMKAIMAQDRILENLAKWLGFEPTVLESQSLDLAVGLGAATYGLVRAGKGIRIRGGTARAYYIGVGSDRAPGRGHAKHGACIIPFGVEEGEEVDIPSQTFELITDRPVSFPLYSSTAPLGHDPGEVVEITDDVFIKLPPLYTVLRSERGFSQDTIPVRVGGRLTELGTLQLWCSSKDSSQQWDLEFSVRSESALPSGTAASAPVPIGDTTLEFEVEQANQAVAMIRDAFRPNGKRGSSTRSPRTLIKDLELLLNADRIHWPGTLIRNLWDPLWDVSANRGLSAEHEATWLNLASILLRPGFGDPLDPGRMENLWTIFRNGLKQEDDLWCRIGWWVLWRRVSGGLSRGQQLEIINKIAPPLLSGAALKAASKVGKSKKGKRGGEEEGGINRQELTEMWRAAASMERIPPTSKEGLGDTALRNAIAGRGEFAFWALGRLGARIPLYGAPEEVANKQKVEGWIERLMGLEWSKSRGVVFSLVHLGRLAGDPVRDISEKLRLTIVDRLKSAQAPEHLINLLLEVKVLQESERGQMFGDDLPTGLRLSY